MTSTQSFHPQMPAIPALNALIAILDNEFTLDQIDRLSGGPEPSAAASRREAVTENGMGLHELPPGPWRSLGRYLDYTNWPDRDRFVALDRAIEKLASEPM